MLYLLKNNEDINKIKISCYIAKEVLFYISKYIKEGISTGEINDICHNRIVKYHNAYPAPLGYMNYPKSVCISVNDTVCHGIPDYNYLLKNGDILNIDVSICKNNYYSDTSKMFFVGKISKKALKLCNITHNSIYYALKYVKKNVSINIIGNKIQEYINNYNYSIVKNYCGHGIGKNLHEEPQILHYKNNSNIIMKPGMVFTIEPMINIGSSKTIVMKDGWTVKTKDKSLSAQYEHMILINNNNYELLI